MSALKTSQSVPACSEHDLVAAVRRGDDRAFGELYARYGRRIVSYVFGMVGDHGRAEDISQEVFMSALRRMRDTERPIAFKPWIYEIARNACIDEFRRTKRAREVPLASDEDDSEGADRRLISRTDSPDATLELRQQLDDLRGAFRGLSDNHHKLIVMRELEGLSYEQIGKRMGMTRPVVESTLFRARRRLTEEYQEIASGRRCEQVHVLIEAGPKSIQSLGIKERRRFARHISHCQPCRRFARAEGLDDSVFQAPGLVGKIAALLPIPAFLRFRRGGGGGAGGESETASSVGSHSFSALQTVQSVAQYVDPTSPAVGLSRAAAAVAAVVVAGGGVVGGLTAANSGGKPQANKPPVVRVAPAGSAGARANQPRVAVPMSAASRAASFSVAKSRGSGSSGGASSGAKSRGSGPSTAGSGGSGGGGPIGSTASTHSGGGSSGGSSSPTLPNVGLPSNPTLPSLPPVSIPRLPPVNVPQIDVPGTVQNTVTGAGNTVNNVVNTLKGIL